MKKTLVFILVLILCAGMTACGSDTSSSSSSTSSYHNSSNFSGGYSSDTKTDYDAPEEIEPSQADIASIQQELNELSANRPKSMISCTYCGGSGRLETPCETCGGSGLIPMREITMFSASVPCSDCRGYGSEICSYCTFGLMTNPEYKAESAAWTERRHELWGMLGYTAEDIHRMEIEEAKAYLGSVSDSGSFDSYESFSDVDSSSSVPGICLTCYGTGDCPTCNGDRLYLNSFTGNQIVCPNCTDGKCWKCNGSGTSS